MKKIEIKKNNIKDYVINLINLITMMLCSVFSGYGFFVFSKNIFWGMYVTMLMSMLIVIYFIETMRYEENGRK